MRHVLSILLLFALVMPAEAKVLARDEAVTYYIPLENGKFIRAVMPKLLFVSPTWISARPSLRHGYGIRWNKVAHPRSRGDTSHFYIEVTDRNTDISLREYATKYWEEEYDGISLAGRTEVVTKVDDKMKKVKFMGTTGYRGRLRTQGLNTSVLGTPNVGNSVTWVLRAGEQWIHVTSESCQTEGDESPLIEKALKIVSSDKPTTHWKFLDQTLYVYRYVTMDVPKGWEPDYTNEISGHCFLWRAKTGAGKVYGAYRLTAFSRSESAFDFDKWIYEEQMIPLNEKVKEFGKCTLDEFKVGRNKEASYLFTWWDKRRDKYFNKDGEKQFLMRVSWFQDGMIFTLEARFLKAGNEELSDGTLKPYVKEFMGVSDSLIFWSADR